VETQAHSLKRDWKLVQVNTVNNINTRNSIRMCHNYITKGTDEYMQL
jgi:hypothetical protein